MTDHPHDVVPGGADARLVAGKTDQQLADRREQYQQDLDAAVAAILRQLAVGTDIGDFIAAALNTAQDHVAYGHTVLDNRPGSWESAALQPLLR